MGRPDARASRFRLSSFVLAARAAVLMADWNAADLSVFELTLAAIFALAIALRPGAAS